MMRPTPMTLGKHSDGGDDSYVAGEDLAMVTTVIIVQSMLMRAMMMMMMMRRRRGRVMMMLMVGMVGACEDGVPRWRWWWR